MFNQCKSSAPCWQAKWWNSPLWKIRFDDIVLIGNDNDDGDNGIDDDNNDDNNDDGDDDDDDSTLGKLSQTPLLSPAKYIITITISKYIAKFIINHVNYDQIYCQTMPNMIIHDNYYQIYCKQILAKNTINQIIAK